MCQSCACDLVIILLRWNDKNFRGPKARFKMHENASRVKMGLVFIVESFDIEQVFIVELFYLTPRASHFLARAEES